MSKLPFSFMLEDIVDFLMQFSASELVKEILQLASCDSGLWFIFFDLHPLLSRTFFPFQWPKRSDNFIYRIVLSVLRHICPPIASRIKDLSMTQSLLPIEYADRQKELKMACAYSTGFPIAYLPTISEFFHGVCFPPKLTVFNWWPVTNSVTGELQ